jgi:hypothetical protein
MSELIIDLSAADNLNQLVALAGMVRICREEGRLEWMRCFLTTMIRAETRVIAVASGLIELMN